MKALSAIIPVANAENRIKNLDSIFERIEKNKLSIRLILVASGHPQLGDSTVLTERYANRGVDVVVVENSHASPGKARNSALPYVNSDWLTFWDDDDMPKVEKYLDLGLKIPNNHIGVGQYVIRNSGNGNIKRVRPCLNVHNLLIDTGFWRLLIPRIFLKNVVFPDLRLGEDRIMVRKLIEDGITFAFSDEILYEYRKGHDSITNNVRANDVVLSMKEQIHLTEKSRIRKKTSLMTVSVFLSYLKNGPRRIKIFLMFCRAFFHFPITYLVAFTQFTRIKFAIFSRRS